MSDKWFRRLFWGFGLAAMLALPVSYYGTRYVTTASAASYSAVLDIGDVAVANCGAALEVTLYGPGEALVVCVKDAASVAYPGAPETSGDGLVTVVDLNTEDDLAVTCPGTLVLEWGVQDVALVCEW